MENFDIDLAVNRYQQLKSLKKVANEFGVSIHILRRALKEVMDIAPNSYSHNRKYDVDNDFFARDTIESFYWAGFIAADGCVSKKMTGIRIDLGIEDIAHLEKFVRFTKDACPNIVSGTKISRFKNDPKEYIVSHCRTGVDSVMVARDLVNNFNIVPAKSLTLNPPDKIPEDMIKHYIRGFFDGDGSIFWDKRAKCAVFRVSGASRIFIEWIRKQILNSVSYNFSGEYAVYNNRGMSCLTFSYSAARAIFNWMYTDSSIETVLDRKYERYLDYYGINRLRNIPSIISDRNKKLSQEDQEAIISYNKAGYNINDISIKLNISQPTAIKYLRIYGLKSPPVKRASNKHHTKDSKYLHKQEI